MAARKGKAPSVRDAISVVHAAMRAELKSDEMEELVKLATSIINQDYWDDVRGIGNDLLRQIKDGDITTRDGFEEALHQDIDGSARIIYTWNARLGLLSTNNVNAYEEEMGEKPEGPEQQLFMAMKQDVKNWLGSNDDDGLIDGLSD